MRCRFAALRRSHNSVLILLPPRGYSKRLVHLQDWSSSKWEPAGLFTGWDSREWKSVPGVNPRCCRCRAGVMQSTAAALRAFFILFIFFNRTHPRHGRPRQQSGAAPRCSETSARASRAVAWLPWREHDSVAFSVFVRKKTQKDREEQC